MKNKFPHLSPGLFFPIPGSGSMYSLQLVTAKSDRKIPDAAIAGYGLQRTSIFNRNLKVVSLKTAKPIKVGEQKIS